jgi:hypothetical protein
MSWLMADVPLLSASDTPPRRMSDVPVAVM